jgi:4-hydroxy-3-methylbut-2-enyl diphosphate reductase
MLVVGGFNSSNTTHLCKIASRHCPTFHVDDVSCLVSPREIRHHPYSNPKAEPLVTADWLPERRPLTIGLTAGASTPNKVIGEVIDKLVAWEQNSNAS